MSKTLALCLALAAMPVAAQDPPAEDIDRGRDLMQEGAKLLFRGLMGQVEPQLRQMQELAEKLGDFRDYEMPEVLPNGDILIRRKAGAPSADLPPPKEGETDL